MTFSVMQVSVMSGALGDIFWDLAPLIAYTPGFDIGCNIFVANPTSTAKEYALMARLSRGATVVSEEALPVFGYTWFKVEPGDFAILRGALRFNESNADLTVSLMERESGEATDAVATGLMAPHGGSPAASRSRNTNNRFEKSLAINHKAQTWSAGDSSRSGRSLGERRW